ncbi:MAG: asparagine synthase (glutamine-hydrolyzing) [Acidobacteriota bacterium]
MVEGTGATLISARSLLCRSMCGIAGIVGTGADPDLVRSMTDRQAHRGPDDAGHWSSEGVALGHRRLSILDLSAAGHQPMELGSLVLTYNGEIYNFRALRDELGGPWKSETDSEVILRLYAEVGMRCVDRLVGMFAFALWDRERRTLFAARDRLGIKPLHYRAENGSFAFASELKALTGGAVPPLRTPSVDRTALRDFFTYKYVPTPKTIYAGIQKLPPAHTLSVSLDDPETVRLERYWAPSSETTLNDPEEALAAYSETLHRVVNEHTLSDVPVGVFLSGGIDSTSVVANLDRPKTFTLGFDRGRDESDAAAQIAEHFGTDHSLLTAGGADLETAVEAVPRMYDEPFGDHGAWPTHLVSKLAQSQVTVALSGEGGDELFAGYHWYDKVVRFRATPWNRMLARALPPLSPSSRAAQRRAAQGVERYSMFLGPFTPRQKQHLLSPDLLDPEYDDLWVYRRLERPELDSVKQMQWWDLHTYLADDMLPKLDRASMAVSLESRPPYVDHRMVELALRTHPDLMRSGKIGKVLARRFLEPRVPDGFLERPKIGFSMPVRRWVAKQPQVLDAALERLHSQGVLRTKRRYRFNSEQIWSLLVLDRWITQKGL